MPLPLTHSPPVSPAAVPDELADCVSLRHLHLYNNRINQLPLSLGWMFPQLVSFDVARNPLKGLPPKMVAQEVFGAGTALALRFVRPKYDGMLAEIRRARARDIFRRAYEMKADAEDRRAHDRMLMMAEDTRACGATLSTSQGLHASPHPPSPTPHTHTHTHTHTLTLSTTTSRL